MFFFCDILYFNKLQTINKYRYVSKTCNLWLFFVANMRFFSKKSVFLQLNKYVIVVCNKIKINYMDTIDFLKQHKSIRKYKKQTIPTDVLNRILEAGIRGSNTGNMQIYSIVLTRDEKRKKELAKFHFGQKMVEDADTVATVCVDINRYHKWCMLRNAGTAYDNLLWLLTGTVDATIVTQNMCVAAESEGIGFCYLGTVLYNSPEIAEYLKLPKGVVPVTTITMGYPDESPDFTERLPLNGVVHYEEYHDYSDKDIDDIFAEKEALPFSKEMVRVNGTENLAQIFTQKRYKKEDNLFISQKLLKFLKDSDFMNNE